MEKINLTPRQKTVIAELKAQYMSFGNDKPDYEMGCFNFFLTEPTESHDEINGWVYSNPTHILHDECEALAQIFDFITFHPNTNISMYANEHVTIHSSIMDFEPTNERQSFEERLQAEIALQEIDINNANFAIYGNFEIDTQTPILPMGTYEERAVLFNRSDWRDNRHYLSLSIEYKRWYTKAHDKVARNQASW